MTRVADQHWTRIDDVHALLDPERTDVWVKINGEWVAVQPWQVGPDQSYRLSPPEPEQEGGG